MTQQRRTFGGYLGPDRYGALQAFTGNGLLLSSGRACLATALRVTKAERLFVPHYICDSVCEAAAAENARVERYALDHQLLPLDLPHPGPRDMVLLVDYFGMLRRSLAPWTREFGAQCIIDGSQAFFGDAVEGCWSFNSARKFFGVPDGAFLFAPMEVPTPTERNEQVTSDHLLFALAGEQGEGLAYHRANESTMDAAFRKCARLSEVMLMHTDRTAVRDIRTANFRLVHEALGSWNELQLPWEEVSGPYHYPFLVEGLRPTDLHRSGVFAPTLWPEVVSRAGVPQWEARLAAHLVPIPVDQRQTADDTRALIDRVLAQLELLRPR